MHKPAPAPKPTGIALLLALAPYLLALPTWAQDIYVYPARGQSDSQLAQERFECHRWAVQQSGFDPTQLAQTAEPRTIRVPVATNAAAGATGKGTLAGAMAGAVIGAHDSSAGQGAVIGAVVGTLAGAIIEDQGQLEARRQAEASARQQADQLSRTQAERGLRQANYRRALSACLEGKGYTVR